MSYLTVTRMVASGVLTQRCVACAAQELPVGEDPVSWVGMHTWVICAQPGWAQAWESADAAAGVWQDHGANEGVITDGMVLSAIQTLLGIS